MHNQSQAASGGIITLLVVIALFVLTQLYMVIPLLSFVAIYTALGPHLVVLGLEPEKIILLRMVGLPGMFAALLAGPIATRIGMQGVAITGYMFASFGLFLVAVLPQSLTGVAIGSLIFVAGVALAIPAMITQFGTMSVPNRAGGMALNGFILFIGASTGPLIVADVSSFTGLLIGLAVVMLLAATCVAGSASLTVNGRRR
ncbi:hypothetical protein [Xenorhabdus sp. KJ12.1]|uniref:hypothetical protein n=1 Tax=Xenorhabdus sp. KJ12.1 TaxID=1851571 RepID=UPI000C0465AF|nr:hypothetical protein [Xenorhabdus sp. KJ12.1]PHM68632.1 hypothetical protein Xekj_03169 [Xenorhabdus sp. KJ12.1]